MFTLGGLLATGVYLGHIGIGGNRFRYEGMLGSESSCRTRRIEVCSRRL